MPAIVGQSTVQPTDAPTAWVKPPSAPDSLLGMSVWNAVLLLTCLSILGFGALMFALNRMIQRCRRQRRKLSKHTESTGPHSQPANEYDDDDGGEMRITHLAPLMQPIALPSELLRERDDRGRVPDGMLRPFFVPREEGASGAGGIEGPLLSPMIKSSLHEVHPSHSRENSGVAAGDDDDDGKLDPEAAKRIALWLRRTSKSNPEEDPASSFCRTADQGLIYVVTSADPFADVPQTADSASERSSQAPALVKPEQDLTPERSRRWTTGSERSVPRIPSGRLKRGVTLPTTSGPPNTVSH